MFILYPDASNEEREKLLINTCAKKEVRNYSHSLQQSEIDAEEKGLAQDSIQLDNVETEFDELKKEYKAKFDNIQARMKERLEKIKFGKKQMSGTLYGIANHSEGRMMYYDVFGELIDSRDLLPDERQGRLNLNAPVETVKKGQEIDFEEIAKDRVEGDIESEEFKAKKELERKAKKAENERKRRAANKHKN